MKISYSHSDDCNVAKDIINYRGDIKGKIGEVTKVGMIRTGEGTEEDRNNMIRAASITNEGRATILNMEGAGIFNKEGGARITNRNGRATGTMVKEVRVTGSSTTITIASRDVTMTGIKGINFCL